MSTIEKSMLPQMTAEKGRRKVDAEDLKAWLGETLDARVKTVTAEMEDRYEKKYKSIVLKQKGQIADLKKEIKDLTREQQRAELPSRPESENFLEQEEKKSGTHPQIQEKSKFKDGSKEFEFEQGLQLLAIKFEDFDAAKNKLSGTFEDEVAKLRASNYNNDREVQKDIDAVHQYVKDKRDPSQTAQRARKEFTQYEDWINDQIEQLRKDLKAEGDGLSGSLDAIEADIGKLKIKKRQLTKGPVPKRDQKLREMRHEFARLDKLEARVSEHRSLARNAVEYIEQEFTTLETRVFTTKQKVGREIEQHCPQ